MYVFFNLIYLFFQSRIYIFIQYFILCSSFTEMYALSVIFFFFCVTINVKQVDLLALREEKTIKSIYVKQSRLYTLAYAFQRVYTRICIYEYAYMCTHTTYTHTHTHANLSAARFSPFFVTRPIFRAFLSSGVDSRSHWATQRRVNPRQRENRDGKSRSFFSRILK